MKDNIDFMLSKKWIRPSNSSFGHPVIVIRKKDGKLQIVIDYQTLNARTICDCFPLPRVDNLLDQLRGCTVFSKMDLFQGYHQVEVLEEHRHKTAFLLKYRLYEFNVLPLGLVNAPATFQHLMN